MQKDKTVSLKMAIDAVHKNYDTILDFKSDGKTIANSIEDILSELPSATDICVATTDTISRQAAINALLLDPGSEEWQLEAIENLPSAQPKYDEWCDDCKEYDNERHCCPRWNRVIRQTIEDMQAAQPRWTTDVNDILAYLDDVVHPLVSPENWNVYSELHDMVSALPSAQPDIPGINVIIDTIKNAINASTGNEAYMVGLRNGMKWCWSALTDKESEYEDMPSAQPEIIRCKDCRYNNDCEIQYSAQSGDEFFCGCAERKDNG